MELERVRFALNAWNENGFESLPFEKSAEFEKKETQKIQSF